MKGMKYNNSGGGGGSKSMNLGGFGNKPAVGKTIPPGAKVKGTQFCTGDKGRENDPNEGKMRRKPGNP